MKNRPFKESNQPVTVIKCNHLGIEKWRYPARVLKADEESITLEAFNHHPEMWVQDILLKLHDRFIETYYRDQWYNVLEWYDRDDDRLKGWYCNICRPAIISHGIIRYDDLALDLLIYPDHTSVLLDEDEFDALALDKNTRQACWRAVRMLEGLAKVIKPYQQ